MAESATAQMSSQDLASYFKRVGYSGSALATLSTLEELHLLHPKAIVFENLDVLLGRPIRLDIESLIGKLVDNKRGGYCFEQNTLFQAVLRKIGFTVNSLGARVQWQYPNSIARPRSHMVLQIRMPDASYIADVGFGLLTLTAPLRLEADTEQPTPHGIYRLVPVGAEMRMEARTSEGWTPVCQISLREEAPADWEVYNWFTSTHPDSRFTRELVAARPAEEVRYGLLNNVLNTYYLDGHAERQIVETPKALAAMLRELFGLDLPEGSKTVLEGLLRRAGAQNGH
jgi:N-hydroxyarylamine O-acetyltransferase